MASRQKSSSNGAYYPRGAAGHFDWRGNGGLKPCEFRNFYMPAEEVCFCEHDAAFGGQQEGGFA